MWKVLALATTFAGNLTNHQFGRECDRSGISAGTSGNRVLGLRAVWYSHYYSNDRCRDVRLACVAPKNQGRAARQLPAGEARALPHGQST